MIIIQIIILYFIQIRHTDNFPPTGTPASSNNNSSIVKITILNVTGAIYRELSIAVSLLGLPM